MTSLAPSGVQASPRASLFSLPLELKVRIVEFVNYQDVNFGHRIDSSGEAAKALHEDFDSSRHGKSLNALFLADMEFSNLAAVWIFKEYKASHCRDDTFILSVSSRHRQHFTRLILDNDADLEDLKYALSISAHCANLHSLTLSYNAATILLGESLNPRVSASDGLNDVRAAFRRCTVRIRRLAMGDGFEAADAATILDAFPILDNLALADARIFSGQTAEHLSRLVEAVLRGGRLKRLAIDRWDGEAGDVLDEAWINADWDSLEALTRLRYDALTLSESDWALFAVFSNRLESLKLTIETTSLVPDLSSSPFPRLRHLQISAYKMNDVATVLGRLADSPLTATLALRDLHEDGILDILRPALERHPTLQHLSVFSWQSPPASSLTTSQLRQYAKNRPTPLFFDFEGAYTPFATLDDGDEAVTASKEERRERTRALCSAVDEVLEFGLAQSARARLMDDYEGAREMVPLIKGLKARMTVEQD